jgi:DNA-binding IclR family transcriptional regulator
MRSIVDALNETVQLAVLDGVDTVYLARIDCSHPVRLASQVGVRLPAYATGLGKALLAGLPHEELTARLRNCSLTAFTAHTITSVVVLLRELNAIRERGYASDNEEYTPGLRCVAVPIRDRHGHDTAAMSISIPLMRASREQLALALPLLAKGSLDVGRRMGNTADDVRLQRLIELPVEVDFGDTLASENQAVS